MNTTNKTQSPNINLSFLLQEGVKKKELGPTQKEKDLELKGRLRTLILSQGLTEAKFFQKKLGISRQYWYRISWGVDICPTYLKIKIANALGVDSRAIWEARE